MTLKKLFVAAAAFSGALVVACGGGRTGPDAGTGGGTGGGTGCVGSCVGGGAGGNAGGGAGGGGGGGGVGGGSGGGGGIVGDGGFVDWEVANLRTSAAFGQKVRLNNKVVLAVGRPSVGSQGDSVFDVWVADPGNANTSIFIAKTFFDTTQYADGGAYDSYVPVPGDIVTVEGVFGRYQNYNNLRGYRMAVGSGFDMVTNNTSATLKIVYQGPGTPLSPVSVTAPFGDAQDGNNRANADQAGAYVTIQGPLTITDDMHVAFQRFRVDGGLAGAPVLQGYNGFEIAGNGFTGVLVNDRFTKSSFDAGAGLTDTGCDYLAWSQDAGTTSVTFTTVSGIWDTYTHAYCQDGGTRIPGEYIGSGQCRNTTGNIPGSNDAGYTYVLWPTRCTTDLPGTVQ